MEEEVGEDSERRGVRLKDVLGCVQRGPCSGRHALNPSAVPVASQSNSVRELNSSAICESHSMPPACRRAAGVTSTQPTSIILPSRPHAPNFPRRDCD